MKIANLVRACFPYVFEHGMISQAEIDEFLRSGSGSVFGLGNKFPVLKVDDGSGDVGFVTDTGKAYTAFYMPDTCSLSFGGQRYLLSCQFHDWSFGNVAAWLEQRGMTEDLIRQAFVAQTSAEDLAADIAECIATLPTDMNFRYALPTEAGRFRVADVNKKSCCISYRRSADGEISDETKTETITASEIKNIAQSLHSCEPVVWDENAESNARPLFSFAALSPNVFIRKDGCSMSLMWDPVREHLPGVYAFDEKPQLQKPKPQPADSHLPLQKIVYGAPGTGKSWRLDEVTRQMPPADVVRTTFHPDSDYATFVGAYKPAMEDDGFKTVVTTGEVSPSGSIAKKDGLVTQRRIVYKFVPQAFLKAYVRAWRNFADATDGAPGTSRPTVYLVIEEINRGNCAQIFGDLFQLLDRRDDGFSAYEVLADADMRRYLAEAFGDVRGADAMNGLPPDIAEKLERVFKGEALLLPPNLRIWATMNTSDQSLFPIDSAFKRRWDWEYVPIAEGHDTSGHALGWQIAAKDSAHYDWWAFVRAANKAIKAVTNSEDKQLGYFFVRPDGAVSGEISAKKFVNKVLFYLYGDVFRDGDLPPCFNKPDGGGTLAFGDFFREDGKVNEDVVAALLAKMLETAPDVIP